MRLDVIRRFLASRRPRRLREPGARQAAVALIVVPQVGGTDGLFIRRARHPQDPWSGQIGLPGGRRDPGDRSLYATAVREVAEETGMRLTRPQLLGELDDVHPRTPTLPSIIIRPFVFALEARPRLSVSTEVAYPLWLRLRELHAGHGDGRPVVRGRRLEVPCFRVGRHVVWGLTYRILTQLLSPVNFSA